MRTGLLRKMAAAGVAMLMLIAPASGIGQTGSFINFAVTCNSNTAVCQTPFKDPAISYTPPGYDIVHCPAR